MITKMWRWLTLADLPVPKPETVVSIYWEDRSREQKRITAPYALGWEEGFQAAYRLFLVTGQVPKLTTRRENDSEPKG